MASSWTDPQVISSFVASFLALAIAVGNGFYNSHLRRKDQQLREADLKEVRSREEEAQVRLVTVLLASTERFQNRFVIVRNYSNSAVLSLVVEVVSSGSLLEILEHKIVLGDPLLSLDQLGSRIEGSKVQALPAGESVVFYLSHVPDSGVLENAHVSVVFTLPSGRRYRTDGGTAEPVSQE